jgi:lipopolysaccharide transport system ATP-binding protein
VNTAIRAEGLSKAYTIRAPQPDGSTRRIQKHALRDVSFEVSEGEVLGIVGRNGAGKSTLLKILSRITAPTSGRVTVYGSVASLLEVGTGMHPEMTGRENIFLNGALLGMSKKGIVSRLDEIVEFAGVAEYIDTPIKRYSSGMKLRLAFAVAAHLSADVMIVDEVLAVGDAEFQAKCLNVMRDGTKAGRTTLLVSHNMAAVENLCSRVIWIDGGHISKIGAPEEVLREYLTGTLAGRVSFDTDLQATHTISDLPVQFTGLSVSGKDGSILLQGDDILIDIEVKVVQRVLGVKFFVRISTIENYPVAAISSTDYLREWNLDPGMYKLTIKLSSVRLLPRMHKLSLYSYTQWTSEIIEERPDILKFEVLESDVLGTGRPIRADRGVTWIPAEFDLQQSDGKSA